MLAIMSGSMSCWGGTLAVEVGFGVLLAAGSHANCKVAVEGWGELELGGRTGEGDAGDGERSAFTGSGGAAVIVAMRD